jgi:hypothetical protein
MTLTLHKNASQSSVILDYLKNGRSITAIEALNIFGCFRLAARIHELRKEGWNILEKIVEGENGKRYASYRLNPFDPLS